MMKQLFSLLGAVMIAAASVPFTAAAEAEPENYERKGKSPDDLYDCIVWNESSIGEVTFDGDETEGGAFNAEFIENAGDIDAFAAEITVFRATSAFGSARAAAQPDCRRQNPPHPAFQRR